MDEDIYYEENFLEDGFPQYPVVGAVWVLDGILYELTEEGVWVTSC